jgi:hypothetical protein
MKTRLNRRGLRWCSAALLFFVAAAAVPAGTVTGVVHNGTNNNKPAAGVDVLLIALQAGMQTVANTKTDADGRYHFDNAAIGGGPMLIRAVYRGVFFHQPLTPGTSTVDVTIYEPTTNPAALQITGRLIVFQPMGDKLLVGEEYQIKNDTNPPAAYFKQDGDFEFSIPEGGEIEQVSSTGPAGMPVTQGTIDKGKGRYAIAYAFQPGDNSVRLSYQVPYAGNQAALKVASAYDAPRVLLIAAPPIQLASAGFTAAGTDQGYNVYARDAVKAGTTFDVSISGTAPTPADPSASAQQQPDQVNGRDSTGPTLEAAPARLDDQKWILLGGLAAIFAVGVGLLLRQPVPAVAGVSTAASPAVPKARKARAPEPKPAPAPSPVSLAEQVTKDVNTDLDSLKDMLLRLELRRQAGTISDEEYARERGNAEQLLRELVQG